VVVVVDDTYLDRVQAALIEADKNVSKAIDQDDYEQLSKAISDSEKDVDKAVDS
jgi:ribosomal protein S20